MQLLGGAELLQLDVDDPGVHRLGDLHERRLPGQGDQRQTVILGGADHGAGQLPDELAAQLHDQPRRAHGDELGDVVGELAGIVGQGYAGGEHELASAQQVRDVGHLAHVHPAHPAVQPVRSRHDPWVAPADGVQGEDVGDSREHLSRISDQHVSASGLCFTACSLLPVSHLLLVRIPPFFPAFRLLSPLAEECDGKVDTAA